MLHRLCQVVDLHEQLPFPLVHSLEKPTAPHKGYLELLCVVSSESISGLETRLSFHSRAGQETQPAWPQRWLDQKTVESGRGETVSQCQIACGKSQRC